MQNWYKPSPYGIYPRGNATDAGDISDRFGTLSRIVTDTVTKDDKERTEQPYLELMQHIMSFSETPDLCRLSRTCTGWYVMIHCTDAFKTAYTQQLPKYLRFRGSWKESAIRMYLKEKGIIVPESDLASRATEQEEEEAVAEESGFSRKRSRKTTDIPQAGERKQHKRDKAKGNATATTSASSCSLSPPSPSTAASLSSSWLLTHTPVMVSRPYFCDHLFQAWMCTILPGHYHLHLQSPGDPRRHVKPQYTSSLKPVDRKANLSLDEFRTNYERASLPVVLTGIANQWPIFKILQSDFMNLAARKSELVRHGSDADAPLRCEHTNMSLADYVRYAKEQTDERPIYMFDAEFGRILDAERLYTVPQYFLRDDFFGVLGEKRPKYRWIIAGPERGGSSFHVDPNYTNAWNANLTGRKRWIFFPPGANPPGVVPSEDMAEVATPVSLTEWLLNYYDASVEKLGGVGYECICEPGDIMFVPSGWWHYVVNLEDSVALTQNYVSECNLTRVIKFLRTMKGSISGIDEDADDMAAEDIESRQRGFTAEFTAAMSEVHPELMKSVEEQLVREHKERGKKRMHQVALLDADSEGFKFNF